MGEHLIDGEFKSDKFPEVRAGLVPLATVDPMAQDLLWEYAQRRREKDAVFSADLESALRLKGYVPPVELSSTRLTELEAASSGFKSAPKSTVRLYLYKCPCGNYAAVRLFKNPPVGSVCDTCTHPASFAASWLASAPGVGTSGASDCANVLCKELERAKRRIAELEAASSSTLWELRQRSQTYVETQPVYLLVQAPTEQAARDYVARKQHSTMWQDPARAACELHNASYFGILHVSWDR